MIPRPVLWTRSVVVVPHCPILPWHTFKGIFVCLPMRWIVLKEAGYTVSMYFPLLSGMTIMDIWYVFPTEIKTIELYVCLSMGTIFLLVFLILMYFPLLFILELGIFNWVSLILCWGYYGGRGKIFLSLCNSLHTFIFTHDLVLLVLLRWLWLGLWLYLSVGLVSKSPWLNHYWVVEFQSQSSGYIGL